MNSSNDRRVIDGVSSRSKHFEPALQQARSRPLNNLSSDLSQSRPEPSITSNRSETGFRLANSWPDMRLALELDGSRALPTHNFNRKFDAQETLTPQPGTIIAIGTCVAVNQPALLRLAFQERQITTWQKN